MFYMICDVGISISLGVFFLHPRLGHEVRSAGAIRRFTKLQSKSPCVYSMNAVAYWLDVSVSHVGHVALT